MTNTNINFVNLTPHQINLGVGEGSSIIPATGTIARVSVTQEEVGNLNGFYLKKNVYGEVENLPEYDPNSNNIYIVSGLVLTALAGSRPDVVGPDTGSSAIRDEHGRITAVQGFVV